jgi:hypothetical protein
MLLRKLIHYSKVIHCNSRHFLKNLIKLECYYAKWYTITRECPDIFLKNLVKLECYYAKWYTVTRECSFFETKLTIHFWDKICHSFCETKVPIYFSFIFWRKYFKFKKKLRNFDNFSGSTTENCHFWQKNHHKVIILKILYMPKKKYGMLSGT